MHDTVAVFGLGSMGSGIARTLAKAGRQVLGVDPSPDAARDLGGTATPADPGTAFRQAGTLVLSLPGSAQVEEVLTGDDGLLGADVGHRLVIDTSTSDPISTRSLAARLTARGHAFVDAPVSGGPAGARTGLLTVFLGGDDDAVAEAADLLAVLAQRVSHVGGPGAGHTAKLINNLLCATHLQATGEALRIARAADLDLERVAEAVNGASGRSAVTEVNLPRWILSGSYDSGFTLGLMARDVALATQTGRTLGVDLPLADLVTRSWAAVRDRHGATDDFNRMAQP